MSALIKNIRLRSFIKTNFTRYMNIKIPVGNNNVQLCMSTVANIEQRKKDKTSRDVLRSVISYKYLRLIKKAIRDHGIIMKENAKLVSLLKGAQEHNIPRHFIDFVSRMAVDTRAHIGCFELFLSNGCHFIIQYEDVDPTRMRTFLHKFCEKIDGAVFFGNVRWQQHFNQKGILSVQDMHSNFNDKKKTELFINKVGAESVQKECNLNDHHYYKILCDPALLHAVKNNLTEQGYEVEEAFVGYVAVHEMNHPGMRNTASSVITELSREETIDNVYSNISWNIE